MKPELLIKLGATFALIIFGQLVALYFNFVYHGAIQAGSGIALLSMLFFIISLAVSALFIWKLDIY